MDKPNNKSNLSQQLSDLMNTYPREFSNLIGQASLDYQRKYKKILILKGDDPSLKDGSSAEHYFDSLKCIEDWIQKCIDEIKIYLKPICYPLFVYLFLGLLEKHTDSAHKFLNNNREKYKAFNDEIDQLALCQFPINKNNPLIYKYLYKILILLNYYELFLY